jgi:hypothetical protein
MVYREFWVWTLERAKGLGSEGLSEATSEAGFVGWYIVSGRTRSLAVTSAVQTARRNSPHEHHKAVKETVVRFAVAQQHDMWRRSFRSTHSRASWTRSRSVGLDHELYMQGFEGTVE